MHEKIMNLENLRFAAFHEIGAGTTSGLPPGPCFQKFGKKNRNKFENIKNMLIFQKRGQKRGLGVD